MKKRIKLLATIVCLVLVGGFLVGNRASSEPEQQLIAGRYLLIAPDLILDTATAGIVDSAGHVILVALEPNGTTIGKYHAAGFVTTITTGTTMTALGQQGIANQYIGGVSVIDTTTGRLLVRKLIYANRPFTPEDLR